MSNFDPKRILTVHDLMSVIVSESSSPLINIRSEMQEVDCVYKKFDMVPYVGDAMFVRSDLIFMLQQAHKMLTTIHPGFRFRIQYGYRHPAVQAEYFVKRLAVIKDHFPDMTNESLIEQTHLQVAYPPVAGHPTGGAIDITIVDASGLPLDMGTAIADYSQPEKCFTYADGLTKEQVDNRSLLSGLLMGVGFAPFNGEWWHFSYGDREWAKFYGLPHALYDQLAFTSV